MTCIAKRLWLALPLFLSGLLWMAAPAAPAAEALLPPRPADLGVLGPRNVTTTVVIARNRLWQPPQRRFVLMDTVRVSAEPGLQFSKVGGQPQKGECRVRLDGCVRFSGEDVGRRVTISYQYRPRRVVLLPGTAAAGYDDALPTMREVLREELEARGFVIVSPDDVADALVEVEAPSGEGGASLGPGRIPALAGAVSAAYVVAPRVEAGQTEVPAGYQSHTWVAGSGRSAHTAARRVSGHVMEVAVAITVLAGATGRSITERKAAGSKRVQFRRFGPARRSLVRELTARLVAEWRDAPLGGLY